MLHSGEDGLQRIEVALRDRIELVVVTPRTADGQSEESGARRADDVGEFVLWNESALGALSFSGNSWSPSPGIKSSEEKPINHENKNSSCHRLFLRDGIRFSIFCH